jgi:Aspartyl protease
MKPFGIWIAFAVPLFSQTIPPQQPTLPPEQSAQTQPRIVEVPLLDCSGLPCLEMATASGKALRLLIDTAEANSYIDTKVAQSLGANLQGLKSDANADIAQVQQTVVPGAKIGDLPMGDFPFMVLDTTPQPTQPGEKPAPFPADGALTFRAFHNRMLQIDYAHHVVRLSEPLDTAQTCPQTCTELVVKHIGQYGPVTLTTTGFSVNGQPIEVQLDTLFTGTMVIYPDSIKKLDLKKLAKAKHKETFPYFQGGMKLGQADGASEAYQSLQFGADLPLYFFTPDDHPNTVSFDATVGSGLLNRGTAIFDFKGMKFWLLPPAAPAQAGSPPVAK